MVLREGAPTAADSACVYLILQGQFELYRSQAERREVKQRAGKVGLSVTRLPTAAMLASQPGDSLLAVAQPGHTFGEAGVLIDAARERTVVAVEPAEVLTLSVDQLAQLTQPSVCARYMINGTVAASKLRRGLESIVTHRALRVVPFFSTLPPSTQQQLAPLLSVSCLDAGAELFAQGDEIDALHIVLLGHLQVGAIGA